MSDRERWWSALEGMRLEAGATETVSADEIRYRVTLYGLLDRVRDLGLGSSGYNRSPRLTRQPTTRRRIDIDALRRHQGDRLPRIADGSIWNSPK